MRSRRGVALFVVKKDAQLTEKALIEHCRKQLTGYKVPSTCTSGRICRRPMWGRSCVANLLVELLQRATTMPVREAGESMRVERDSVYVIPPTTT